MLFQSALHITLEEQMTDLKKYTLYFKVQQFYFKELDGKVESKVKRAACMTLSSKESHRSHM